MARKLYIKHLRLSDERVRLGEAPPSLLGATRTIWCATDDPAEADVLLVNTCSVREKAAEKLFSRARAMEAR